MSETIRAAWVIARRDFAAIIFSKTFFFFLLGPLFPVAMGVAAGGLAGQVKSDIDQPSIAVVMERGAQEKLEVAHIALVEKIGSRRLPALTMVTLRDDKDAQIAALLAGEYKDAGKVDAVLSGTLDNPVLTGPPNAIASWQGTLALLIDYIDTAGNGSGAAINVVEVEQSVGIEQEQQLLTAQAGQTLLFLLTMLLAGMVLSNLVEEKTNKIIEILAAAIPIDAIFLGKLFAMLAMAMIGITVWASAILVVLLIFGDGLPALPVPAIGWPIFIILGILYFSMAYLLLGSLFLGIGSLATTVREVQTLSMPVTMGQVLVFFIAVYSVTKMGEPVEWGAVIFPFSSPFAMLARAAQDGDILQHVLALAWQIGWAYLIIRLGARIFKRNVMKSGPQTKKSGPLAFLGIGKAAKAQQ
jgi:ABC-2 type transport system permease protein